MTPPENAVLYETTTSTCWIDEDGILNLHSKSAERTLENYKEVMEVYKKLSAKSKLCVLVESSKMQPVSKDVRNYLATELPKYVKVMAMISESPLGRMISNSFILLNPSAFPAKMFGNETEAKEWLKQYL